MCIKRFQVQIIAQIDNLKADYVVALGIWESEKHLQYRSTPRLKGRVAPTHVRHRGYIYTYKS